MLNRSTNTSLTASQFPQGRPRSSVTPNTTMHLTPTKYPANRNVQKTPDKIPSTVLKQSIPLNSTMNTNNTQLVEASPTIILQEQHIIHHTYYPVPVERGNVEAVTTDVKEFFMAANQQQNQNQRDPMYEQKINVLLERIDGYRKENDQLQQQNTQLKNQITQQTYSQQELERLRATLDIKDAELQQLRGYVRQPSTSNPNNQTQILIQSLHTQIDDLNQALDLKSNDYDQLKRDYDVQQDQLKQAQSKQEILPSKSESTSQISFAFRGQQLSSGQQDSQPPRAAFSIENNTNKYQDQIDLLVQMQDQLVRVNNEKDQVIQELRNRLTQTSQVRNDEAQRQQIIEQLQEEKQRANTNYKETLGKLKTLEFQSELEIQHLKYRIQQLTDDQIKSQANQDRVKQLEAEVADWRLKFQQLNREYHTQQERLTMSLAELDSIKKRLTANPPFTGESPNDFNPDRQSVLEMELRSQQQRLYMQDRHLN